MSPPSATEFKGDSETIPISKPPKTSINLLVSIPEPHVLMLTFNRPKARNAMCPALQADIELVMDWFDDEPSLWVCVLTGNGNIFCAGADLIAWRKETTVSLSVSQEPTQHTPEGIVNAVHGFGGLSRRTKTTKPIIAAVEGGAYGGGMEILLNCDLVIASQSARFALPEVKVGVVAAAGGIPRLYNNAGRQFASEMLYLGKTVTAKDAHERFRFVNLVVPPTTALKHALSIAHKLCETSSPDAVSSTKRGLLLSAKYGDVDEAMTIHAMSQESKEHYASWNLKEGLAAFGEKREPRWRNPAKL